MNRTQNQPRRAKKPAQQHKPATQPQRVSGNVQAATQTERSILGMQQTIGNQAVQRWLQPGSEQLATMPLGKVARAPDAPEAEATESKPVTAEQVERLAAEIERVVGSAEIEGLDNEAIAHTIATLREYGNTGKVVWGETDGAYGTYDHKSDLITLSAEKFDINNPGSVAAVAVFHEANHATRWKVGGVLADADLALDLSRDPTERGAIRATTNRELKYYREESEAHRIDRQVLYAYFVEEGIKTAEAAAESLANFDPTTGASARKCKETLGDLLTQFAAETQRDIDRSRFFEDAHAYALTGENIPVLDSYLL